MYGKNIFCRSSSRVASAEKCEYIWRYFCFVPNFQLSLLRNSSADINHRSTSKGPRNFSCVSPRSFLPISVIYGDKFCCERTPMYAWTCSPQELFYTTWKLNAIIFQNSQRTVRSNEMGLWRGYPELGINPTRGRATCTSHLSVSLQLYWFELLRVIGLNGFSFYCLWIGNWRIRAAMRTRKTAFEWYKSRMKTWIYVSELFVENCPCNKLFSHLKVG